MKKIRLTRGKHALVDDEDYEELSQYNWQASPRRQTWYAQRIGYRNGRRTTIHMHCHLLKWHGGIDHINHNGLDNRRENLRKATQSVNKQNTRKKSGTTSRYLGVSWSVSHKKWQVQIRIDGKSTYVGRSVSELEAARLYDKAALEHYGRQAQTNLRQ
jgi:hypothetical protein